VQPDCLVVVAQSIGKQGQRQLSRAAAAIAPAKAGRGMVEQVQPQRQWLAFLAVTDSDEGLSRDGIAVGCADVGFAGHCFAFCSIAKGAGSHRRAPRVWSRRSALRSAIRLSAAFTAESTAVLFRLSSAGCPGWGEPRADTQPQYSSASMIVITRLVTDGSAGSWEWYVRLSSK
jgi:hypothetical protein